MKMNYNRKKKTLTENINTSKGGMCLISAFATTYLTTWRRQWHPTPVLLPGEFQGRGSLVGCHLWGHTESDTTEVT